MEHMTAILATTRKRMFDIPHKGLRNILSQLCLMAGNTDYRNAFAIGKLHQTGQELFVLLDEHAAGENAVLLADLEQRCPGAGQHNLDDHEEIEHRQAALALALDTLLAGSKTGADMSAEGHQFFQLLSQFHAAYIQHMLEEENDTQAQLWAHFTDEELDGMTGRIISKIQPDVMLLWVKWSAPALPHAERTAWVRAMKAGAPAPFFAQVMAALEGALPPLDLEMLMGEL